MTKRKLKNKHNEVGRPTKMTPDTVNKLEHAFSIGASDMEACVYAGICKQTLYNYQNENSEFVDRKNLLKAMPILKARLSVYNNLDNPNLAFKFLERKMKSEFSLKTVQDVTVETKPQVVLVLPDNER